MPIIRAVSIAITGIPISKAMDTLDFLLLSPVLGGSTANGIWKSENQHKPQSLDQCAGQ
jgi:hypothetical protein